MFADTGNQSKWRATEGLRTALSGLFVLVVVGCLASGFAHQHRASVIARIKAGTATLREAQHADDLVRAATLVGLCFAVATGVVFILWQWRSAKNAEAFGQTAARYRPGWSIGGWFVPLANFVIPVLIMQDLWRSSDPHLSPEDGRRRPRSALVGWWWAAFVVACWAARGADATDTSSLSDLRAADNNATLAVALLAVAAILAIAVVRSITARQVALRVWRAESDWSSASASGAGVRCATCAAEYITGTVLCPDCLGTDLQPIAEP